MRFADFICWPALPALLLGLGHVRAQPHPATDFDWNLPPGFAAPRVPSGNPMSFAKVQLGRRLFFDTRLSVTGQYACASCHQPAHAYTDALPYARGATGALLDRSTMSLVNIGYATAFGWSASGSNSLESQMRKPLFNRHPIEIGLSYRQANVVAQFKADRDLALQFKQAFAGSPSPVSIEHVIQAIACFERTLLSRDSAFDRYVFMDERALPASAKRGMALFFAPRVGCVNCHSGVNFSGPLAVAGRSPPPARYADTGTGGRFKVPTLRNIALTAPYMHDGRFADLGAVIDHYQRRSADFNNATRDARLMAFQLDEVEKQDLIDFLKSLSDLQFSAKP